MLTGNGEFRPSLPFPQVSARHGCVFHSPVLSSIAARLPSRDDWLAAAERIAALERPGDLSRLWRYAVRCFRPGCSRLTLPLRLQSGGH